MGRFLSVIGAGGKTTSLLSLAKAMPDQRVLLTTTTHILPVLPPVSREFLPDPDLKTLLKALEIPGTVCAGTINSQGKLSQLPPELLKEAAAAADLTICEADGAHMLPLKLHREGEPVIPEYSDSCLILMGLSAIGQPVSQAIHRFQRNPRWREYPEKITDVQDVLFCIQDALKWIPARNQVFVFLNQMDALADKKEAEKIRNILRNEGIPCRAGSLQQHPEILKNWIL